MSESPASARCAGEASSAGAAGTGVDSGADDSLDGVADEEVSESDFDSSVPGVASVARVVSVACGSRAFDDVAVMPTLAKSCDETSPRRRGLHVGEAGVQVG
ncbi:hypothetical protein GCM10027169_10600 [Gordonia jinhuaensis]|uniref:Uncharacterized protein n=1 Tax=Gordonia jinhuaensis TaxID=1517702 RepID=A0A916SVB5_9ACTN|nr:hypothetical protein GCM10011489_04760 [Gordonia jinhuaensis]